VKQPEAPLSEGKGGVLTAFNNDPVLARTDGDGSAATRDGVAVML
jgi:hypothetical protein